MENQGPSGGQVIILSFHGPRRGAQEVGLARKLRHQFPGACYDVINRGIKQRGQATGSATGSVLDIVNYPRCFLRRYK